MPMAIDHERLTELFTEAMDLSRKEQAELVMNLGHEDPELAKELAALLSADDEIVSALRTAGLKPDDASAGLRINTVPAASLGIPGYRMLGGTLGSGGMGVVYDAEHVDSKRRVAMMLTVETAIEARPMASSSVATSSRLPDR